MPALEIVIGNKNYSSWSLRAWLALRATGEPFTELRLRLDTPEFAATIGRHSPTGRVPVLRHGSLTVWDSLAIGEYLAETFPHARLLPEKPSRRAFARAINAEMHAGFAALRAALPMNVRASGRRVHIDDEVSREIARIAEIWTQCRAAAPAEGPWLFGHFTLSDAMYAPVASRINTYGVDAGEVANEYIATVLHSAAMREWTAAARAEPEVIDREEVGQS